MSGSKTLRRAVLLIWMFGAVALSQSITPVVQGDVATFTLRDGGTVWDIWTQHSTVPWAAFYGATAALNPEEARDRFTSVPVGSLIRVPLSALQMNYVSVLPSGVSVNTSEASMLSGQVENLSAAVLSQNSSIQSVSTSVESLALAVQTLGETLPRAESAVVVTPLQAPLFAPEVWILAFLVFTLPLVLAILALSFFLARSQKKLRAVVRDLQHYPAVVPRTRDEERDRVEIWLHRENRELRESKKALEAEKKGLEAQITSYTRLLAENKQLQEQNEILNSVVGSLGDRLGLYEESPELPVAGASQRTRRGTHGGGRRYNS